MFSSSIFLTLFPYSLLLFPLYYHFHHHRLYLERKNSTFFFRCFFTHWLFFLYKLFIIKNTLLKNSKNETKYTYLKVIVVFLFLFLCLVLLTCGFLSFSSVCHTNSVLFLYSLLFCPLHYHFHRLYLEIKTVLFHFCFFTHWSYFLSAIRKNN